jgi:nucleoside triphosphate diphosphatase
MADTSEKQHGMDALLRVMTRLRDPEAGCPWDAEQTFATIAPYTIEEAYEVADAIARDDMRALKEELGDLLLQVVYHSEIASEQGRFAFADIVQAITEKMIRRHPTVFAEPSLREAFLKTPMWEGIKAEEKAARGEEVPASVLDGVPAALSALTRAVKLQKRAASVGFDWPSLAPVLAKAEKELVELKDAISTQGGGAVKEELGDLLFVMANLARHLGVDPEAALREANAKFVRRFAKIEAALAREGRAPAQSTLEEMDALWDEAKAQETKD